MADKKALRRSADRSAVFTGHRQPNISTSSYWSFVVSDNQPFVTFDLLLFNVQSHSTLGYLWRSGIRRSIILPLVIRRSVFCRLFIRRSVSRCSVTQSSFLFLVASPKNMNDTYRGKDNLSSFSDEFLSIFQRCLVNISPSIPGYANFIF